MKDNIIKEDYGFEVWIVFTEHSTNVYIFPTYNRHRRCGRLLRPKTSRGSAVFIIVLLQRPWFCLPPNVYSDGRTKRKYVFGQLSGT